MYGMANVPIDFPPTLVKEEEKDGEGDEGTLLDPLKLAAIEQM